MPEAHDRLVDAETKSVGRWFILLFVLIVGGSIALGLLVLVSRVMQFDVLVANTTKIERLSQENSVDDVLKRCSAVSADYIPECRLLIQRLCNQPATESVMRVLFRRNDHLGNALLGAAFLEQCDNSEAIGLFTVMAHFHLTDFERSLSVIDRFPLSISESAEFASWRGFVLEKLGRFEEAANEYQRSLYLFPDLSNVGAMQFYYSTRMLKQIGRYCDAVAPLQQYVGFDPASRLTSQIEEEIRSLRRLGNCPSDESSGPETVLLDQQQGLLVVNARVNGVEGRFILDTGASTVHLTHEFAVRAKIVLQEDQRITVQGVTGSRLDYFGIVPSVTVEKYRARNVPVTIASVSGSIQEGIDGLLGQTFLGRFHYSIKADRLMLMPLSSAGKTSY